MERVKGTLRLKLDDEGENGPGLMQAEEVPGQTSTDITSNKIITSENSDRKSDFASILPFISDARLQPYLNETDGDIELAGKRYELNARVSESFYRPLQGLEITVRNSLNNAFCEKFGDDWYVEGKMTFHSTQAQSLREALYELEASDKEITAGAVVAELSFGFWVGILGPKSEIEIYRKAGWKAFPHRGKGNERKQIQGALNSLRRLRNRVFHHERILHRDLQSDYDNILKVLGWICPETKAWVSANNSFDISAV